MEETQKQPPDGDQRRALQRASHRAEELERRAAWDSLLTHLDQCIERWGGEEWLMRRARVHAWLGDRSAARADWRHVLRGSPAHAEAAVMLVLAGFGDDAGGPEAIEALRAEQCPNSLAAARLGYAQARLLEAQQLHTEAFEQYREANAVRAVLGGMDLAAKLRGAQAILSDFAGPLVERFAGAGAASERPVFIVGMPRSGTTLTEQILAAHPDVQAMGEQLFLGEVLQGLLRAAPPGPPLLEAIDSLDGAPWRRAGEAYLERVAAVDDRAPRVTDKLPANFALLPWIRLLLPNARVVHLEREPLATLLSCIRTPFAEPSLAFTVEDWARLHGLYQGLMDQWRPLLGDRMLTVRYEHLVMDQKDQTRRLLDFLGLEWEPACLHPERVRQAVRTASTGQVRRAVHANSVDAWRRFSDQLEPLRPLIEESRGLLGPR